MISVSIRVTGSVPSIIVPESVYVDPEAVSLRRLRATVSGRESLLPRTKAMALLAASDFPNRDRDLGALLDSKSESSTIRALAAMLLGRVGGPAALAILLQSAETADGAVLIGVARGLARIADRTALDVLARASQRSRGLPREQARFAAAVIAYRLGLDGHEPPTHEGIHDLDLAASAARPVRWAPADHADAELCLRSLGMRPYGIEIDERSMYEIRCGTILWILALNRDLVGEGATRRLVDRKALLGLVSVRNDETGLYSVALLMLTSPVAEGFEIRLYRQHGALAMRGRAVVDGRVGRFSIRAVARPGALPIEIDGMFHDGAITLKRAVSATTIQASQEPSEDDAGRRRRAEEADRMRAVEHRRRTSR